MVRYIIIYVGCQKHNKYSENRADTKRTTVEANSMESLLEKISNIDWNTVKAQNVPDRGGKYDFSV